MKMTEIRRFLIPSMYCKCITELPGLKKRQKTGISLYSICHTWAAAPAARAKAFHVAARLPFSAQLNRQTDPPCRTRSGDAVRRASEGKGAPKAPNLLR
jgi:hypothetical protein